MVVGGRRDADAVRVHAAERPGEDDAGRFAHDAAARGVDAEPVAELAALVEVGERLEPHDAEEATADAVANGEPARTRVVPVRRGRVRVPVARLDVRRE